MNRMPDSSSSVNDSFDFELFEQVAPYMFKPMDKVSKGRYNVIEKQLIKKDISFMLLNSGKKKGCLKLTEMSLF